MLRKALEIGFLQQIPQIISNEQLSGNLDVKFPQLPIPSYAKYQIYGAYGLATSSAPYKNPTTPGTRPINASELLQLITDKINKYIKKLRFKQPQQPDIYLQQLLTNILSVNFPRHV